LWDAAFDAGLVSFADDGTALASPQLSKEAQEAPNLHPGMKLAGLTPAQQVKLGWHRAGYEFEGNDR
jgi:hypothetical protein